MAVNEQNNIISNMAWRFGERMLAQGVTFIVSVVLARLLTPSDYGNVAILMIFIDLAEVFVVHGFGSALVQKKDADSVDFSSVFYFSIILTLVIYAVCFVCAPILGIVFGSAELIPLFRVLALRVPLSGINSVQQAYVQRKMIFKKFFFSTLGGTIGSAVIGVAFAYKGLGTWAIVAQYLSNSLCDTIILWITVKWRPQKLFSIERLKGLFNFGWKMLGSQLIHVMYNRLSSFIIGLRYSTSDLAYYEQGSKIPSIVETNIDTTINSVLFPAMSKEQDKREHLKQMVRKSITVGSMIVWPLMVGLFVLANRVVVLVYTEKWLPCVIFMQIACVRLAIEPIQTANLQAIKALGRSDLYIKMEIIKKGYGILILLITMRISIIAIALGTLSQAFFAFIVNSIPNHQLLSYKYSEQIMDLIPSIAIAAIMGICVTAIGYFLEDTILTLVIQVVVGATVYILLTFWLRRKDFMYVFNMLMNVLKERGK